MALCSVADVQVHVTPTSPSLTDAVITAIINSASDEVASRSGGSASSTDVNLKLACVHTSAAIVLRRMRANGELAASIKVGNYTQQNNIDTDIQNHEDNASRYIRKYMFSAGSASIVSGRMGPGTVNNTL